MTVRTANGPIYIAASQGNYSYSRDGANYQSIPASQATALVRSFEGIVTAFGVHLTNVRDLGGRHEGAKAVEEYRATLPGRVVQSQFSSLAAIAGKSTLAGLSYRPVTEIVDVDPSTGFPVRIVDSAEAELNLASLHRPRVSGVLIAISDGTRRFSHFRAH